MAKAEVRVLDHDHRLKFKRLEKVRPLNDASNTAREGGDRSGSYRS